MYIEGLCAVGGGDGVRLTGDPLRMRDGYEWCRAEEKHWRGLRMAVSSILSDAKAVVVNHSECLRTANRDERRTPTTHAPTRSHIAHASTVWDLDTPTPCAGIVRAWAFISDDLRRGKACSGLSCLIQLMQNHALVSQDVVIALDQMQMSVLDGCLRAPASTPS